MTSPDDARLIEATARLRQAEVHRRPVAPVTEELPAVSTQ